MNAHSFRPEKPPASDSTAQATGAHRPIRFGIRHKMLAILLSVLVVALSTSGWLTLRQQEQDLYQAIQLRGQEVVKHASHALALYAVSYDYHSIQILLDEIITSPDIIHSQVTSAKGNIMATAGPPAAPGEQRPTFVRPITFDDRQVGELMVELDPRDIVRRVEQSRNELLWRELILILLVATGEFVALSYFIARPVGVISDALAANIDEDGRIRNRIPIRSNDEFGRLSAQFNLMREQLNRAHHKLQSRIQAADARLLETNQTLRQQSEELTQANRRLVELTITDALTGLYNRRHFEQTMQQALTSDERHERPCSLMIMDIDRFKDINDTHGHAVGDAVLRGFAQIVRDNIRQHDIPCRIGGEEFAVACRHTNRQEALRLAERLRQAAEFSPVELDGVTVPFTISVGITSAGGDQDSLDAIFKQADLALYHSKQHGRNRVTHHAALTDQAEQA